MDSPEAKYEIRQAIMTVNDRDANLRVIQEIRQALFSQYRLL